MLGLLLAAVYVGIVVLAYGSGATPEALHDASSYAFYWYAVWAVIIQFFTIGTALLGAVLAVSGLRDASKYGGLFRTSAMNTAAGGGFLILGGIIATLASAVTSALWIAVALLVYYAAPEPLTASLGDWDSVKLVIAGILAFIGSMIQIRGAATTTTTSKRSS